MLDLVMPAVFPAIVAFAGAMDVFTMKIPNKVSIALAAAFFVMAPIAGLGLVDVGLHVAAGSLVLAVTVAMFFAGWMGGGDAKLVSAVALWVGFDNLLEYLVLVGLAGGALAIALLAFRAQPLPPTITRHAWVMRLHDRQGGIPYGIALAAAALLVYPNTNWFSALHL